MAYSFIIRFLERKKKKNLIQARIPRKYRLRRKFGKGKKTNFPARKHSLYLLSFLESTKGEAVV